MRQRPKGTRGFGSIFGALADDTQSDKTASPAGPVHLTSVLGRCPGA